MSTSEFLSRMLFYSYETNFGNTFRESDFLLKNRSTIHMLQITKNFQEGVTQQFLRD